MRAPTHIWTKEQIEFLNEYKKGISRAEITRMLNEKFEINLTENQIKRKLQSLGIKNGITGRFYKGLIPHNKGKKMSPEQYEKAKPTMFKPGHIPHNHVPVGSTSITEEGYIRVKVEEPNKWKMMQQVVWEQHYGPIPKGHVIIFLDNNRQNCSIENLKMISKRENQYLNNKKLRFNDAKLTKVAAVIAKLEKSTYEAKARAKK